jgi:carbamoylphosphate synthase large subunit
MPITITDYADVTAKIAELGCLPLVIRGHCRAGGCGVSYGGKSELARVLQRSDKSKSA